MALVSEVLHFIVEVDSARAISAFNRLSGSSRDTASALRTIGDLALEGFRVAGRAMNSVVDSASDLNEAMNFSERVFGKASKGIEDWAKTSARSVGLSHKAALESAASMAVFGRQIGLTDSELVQFSTSLVGLASDMASVRNTTPEDAVRALGAAFRGEYEPLRKYGVVLNDAGMRQEALKQKIYDGTGTLNAQQKILSTSAILFGQLDYAIGDFINTSDQLANRQRILSANFENLKASIGQALLPTFSTLTSYANSMVEAFLGLPAPMQQFVGHMLALGTVSLGAVVGLTKLSAAVTSFAQATGHGTRAAGLLSSAVGSLSKTIGLVGIAFAALDFGFAAWNTHMKTAERQTDAFNKVLLSLRSGTQSANAAFNELTGAVQDNKDIGDLWEYAWGKHTLFLGQTKRSVADLDEAFRKLLTTQEGGVDVAEAFIDQIAKENEEMRKNAEVTGHSAESYEATNDQIQKWAEWTRKARSEQDRATKSAEEFQKMIDKTSDRLEVKYVPTVKDLSKALDGVGRAASKAADGADAFASAMDSMNQSSSTDAAYEFAEAIDDVRDAVTKAKEDGEKYVPVMDDLAVLHTNLTDAQKDVRKSLDATGEAGASYVKTLIAQGVASEIVVAQSEDIRKMMYLVAKQAGLTDAQAGQLIATYGLMPEQIETAIKIKDEAIAKFKVETLLALYDELPEEIVTELATAISENDLARAERILAGFVAEQNRKRITIPVYLQQGGYVKTSPGAPGYGPPIGGGPRSMPPAPAAARASTTNVSITIGTRQTASAAYAEARKFARRNGGRAA